ncbi:hypothetical protein ACFO0N_10040 [Halobium salinum]|uniref:Uncharacterized protein n=1 Tax=Halobium salinum TaxID=1364940 RepID=A0ABD5PCB3_9EURY|nr:hypothetical protein [Halobium salinum]
MSHPFLAASTVVSALTLLQPRGVFGVPHGLLSSADERAAFAIGLVALLCVFAYDLLVDGDLDLRPVRSAAAVGVAVSLGVSAAAPPRVADEWHVAVVVVVLFVGAVVVFRRRRRERGPVGAGPSEER